MSCSGCYSWCDPPHYFCSFCTAVNYVPRNPDDGLPKKVRPKKARLSQENFNPPKLRRETRQLSENAPHHYEEYASQEGTQHHVSQEEGYDDPGIIDDRGHKLASPAAKLKDGLARRSADVLLSVLGNRKKHDSTN